MSLRPGQRMVEWDTVVEPVDRDNTARLRAIVGRHGWPGHRLVGEAGAHAAWLLRSVTVQRSAGRTPHPPFGAVAGTKRYRARRVQSRMICARGAWTAQRGKRAR
jgi:hypothetical protein